MSEQSASKPAKPQPNRVVQPPRVVRVVGAGVRRVERTGKRALWHRRLRNMINELPESLRPAAEWVVTGAATEEERALAARVEQIRAGVAATDRTMTSYHSPQPGTFRVRKSGSAAPGPKLRQSARAHAKTGSKPRKGLLLRRLVIGSGATRILELGTNTGLSASYLVSAPTCELLTTIEGSPDLCEVARENISNFSDAFEVRCQLFDDALTELSGTQPYDLVFIDGQHEGEATAHYCERVLPLTKPDGGMVVFDDIYWSKDMHKTWLDIAHSETFALTVDFGVVGLGVLGTGPHQHVDFTKYLGAPHIPRRISDQAH